LGEFVGIFLDEIGELVHEIAALLCGSFYGQGPFSNAVARGAYGFVNVGSVGFRYLGDDFAC